MLKNNIVMEEKKHENKANKQQSSSKKKLAFKAILCPKTCAEISSAYCRTCSHKQELGRGHKSGRVMLTIICNWEEKKVIG